MNVMLIAQCSKNALTETRRIVDQFAERRGERTWQTTITQQGLDTLYRLLRKTARKNTAVACHWIRGRNHSELLWIVGDARQFNTEGATPTNITQRDILRAGDENDWHAGEDIQLLARLAALFHDLGKANDAFQKKLTCEQAIADPYRHEWVSLRLFAAFVGKQCTSDRDWLERLSTFDDNATKAMLDRLIRDGASDHPENPFKSLQFPLARAVAWLIVSHHLLPTPAWGWSLKESVLARLLNEVAHDWCNSHDADAKSRAACWTFSRGLPCDSRHWRQHVGKVVEAILKRPALCDDNAATLLGSPYVLHLARLTLMLADHAYSAQASHPRYGDPSARGKKALYANSQRVEGKKPTGKQGLDEHLIGVESYAARLMHALPRLEKNLPHIARHRGFRKRSSGIYRWQNAAFDLAESLRQRTAESGFFGINLASTGCGKTLANGRILYALADPRLGARFTVALGLRTLTLQTGDAYRERLHLGPEDLAVLVGGSASRALHKHGKTSDETFAANESAADLLPAHSHVRYDGSLEDGPLKRWLYPENAGERRRNKGRHAAALLDAPVLICTVDHLMPATEGVRGGHQILPMLRLMSSDLVLDEPDDFDIADLSALTRLVHWAGLLGSRVLLSSATLPPSLVQGLFLAYCAGRREFQRYRGCAGERLAVCCAWFDEFGTDHADHNDDTGGSAFLATHSAFIERRMAHLTRAVAPKRRAGIVPLAIDLPRGSDKAGQQEKICAELATQLHTHALNLHQEHHSIDTETGKRVSFGLIRMANIDPLFDVARAFFAMHAASGCRIHLCVYHGRHPLLVRAAIERELDATLKRHDSEAVFRHKGIRAQLDHSEEGDHLFIVLATAVAEVGRDHDYDWAIVEPSSMRSIIQLAGRVMRHRDAPCPPDLPNILLLDTNIRHLKTGMAAPAFTNPGFETADFRLKSHCLSELLTPEQWQVIDARARIQPRARLDPAGNLVDLEHERLSDLLLGAQAGHPQVEKPTRWWWTTAAHLGGVLQQATPFRKGTLGDKTFALLPDEDCTSVCLVLLPNAARTKSSDQSKLLHQLTDEELITGHGITPWGTPDYLPALLELAERFQLDPAQCARRFGIVDLPEREDLVQRWRYHPVLGFAREK